MLGGFRVDARLVIRVAKPGFLHHIEKDICKIVYRVIAVLIDAAHDGRLRHEVSTVVFAGPLREEKDMLRGLGREAEEQLARPRRRDSSRFQVRAVIGIEILVDPAERDGRVDALQADGHVGQPKRLQRFMEGGGRLVGDLRADAPDLLQFGLPYRAAFVTGQAPRLLCQTPAVGDNSFTRDYRGPVELRPAFLNLVDIPPDPDFQNFLVIRKKMAYPARLVDQVILRVNLLRDVTQKTSNMRVEGAV